MLGALSANDTDKPAMPGSASFQTDCCRKEGKAGAEIIAGASSAERACRQRSTGLISPSSLYFYNLKCSAIREVTMSALSPASSAAHFQIVSIGKALGAEGFSS